MEGFSDDGGGVNRGAAESRRARSKVNGAVAEGPDARGGPRAAELGRGVVSAAKAPGRGGKFFPRGRRLRVRRSLRLGIRRSLRGVPLLRCSLGFLRRSLGFFRGGPGGSLFLLRQPLFLASPRRRLCSFPRPFPRPSPSFRLLVVPGAPELGDGVEVGVGRGGREHLDAASVPHGRHHAHATLGLGGHPRGLVVEDPRLDRSRGLELHLGLGRVRLGVRGRVRGCPVLPVLVRDALPVLPEDLRDALGVARVHLVALRGHLADDGGHRGCVRVEPGRGRSRDGRVVVVVVVRGDDGRHVPPRLPPLAAQTGRNARRGIVRVPEQARGLELRR
mmetsp:Transcript_3399/g.14888  ORF Transcript_3399/g.14888 Transcript_3399/m.14888 type:complete len:333 (+) Transcript_3399:3389-4387(+)